MLYKLSLIYNILSSGEAEVQIRITDKNDNSPYFKKAAYYAEVAENADVGSLVLLVTAEDEDEGVKGFAVLVLFNVRSQFIFVPVV